MHSAYAAITWWPTCTLGPSQSTFAWQTLHHAAAAFCMRLLQQHLCLTLKMPNTQDMVNGETSECPNKCPSECPTVWYM